ncbi:hypothetical protein Tco_0143509 [Tanacetum coccineum]
MQMLYCFVNNIHVDYAELLWEGFYYSLYYSTTSIPYPRFTKIIIGHYMTNFPEISRRARDKYHNLSDDDLMKNIFNSGRYKDKVGMKILDWMITDEMKLTEHYRMYAEVFGLDVPMTQSQPTKSTQGMHRTLSAPRSPNPEEEAGESSAPRRLTVIRLRIPQRRSPRLTLPAPVPTVDEADDLVLQDTIQVSLAEQKSREEQKAKENVELVKEHLAAEEIEKMVEEPENVVDDSSIPRNDEHEILGTRLEPRSDKESLEVEINDSEKAYNMEEEITNVVIPVNVDEEEDAITDKVYELKQREKGKIVEESRSTPFPSPIRSPRIHDTLISLDTEKLQELTAISTPSPSLSSLSTKLSTTNRLLSLFKTKPSRFKCYKSFFQELQGQYGYLFGHLKVRFMERKSFNTLVDHLQDVMVESLPIMADKHIKEQVTHQVHEQVDAPVRSCMSGHILHVHPAQPTTISTQEQQYQLYLSMKYDLQLQQEDIAIWLALKMKFERLQLPATTCQTPAIRPRDQDDPHDDAHPEGENSAKRKKMSEYGAYVSGESSSGQVNESDQGPSSLSNQEQVDDYDFWTDSYASDDDEIPTKIVSQDIMDEVSLTIDEAMLKKVVDEMLRQRCTSRDEHQYHIDQMKNFMESDIVWESRKEILISPHPRKVTPLVQSCQRDPKAPTLSLINQDLLYLKKGSSGSEKTVLSLHKFLAVIFNDDDIEERTSRWVNKCVKKFNPYARYGVEHWKNPHAKIFYIRKQKEPGKPKEVVYSNSKIIQVIKTYWELGHEHKFITEIVVRRANECIMSITEPDFKNLNKNDIEDIYLLIMNGKVPDYAETGFLWSLSVFIRSSVIWERVHDF